MSQKVFIELLDLPGKSDWKMVLTTLGEKAISKGWAKEGYCEALIQREEKFPTGLETKTIGVALPHADPEWVDQSAILIGILESPVKFNKMDDFRAATDVNLVFLISLPSEKGHMTLLKNLVTVISDNHFLQEFINYPKKESIVDFLSSSTTDELHFV